jgi:hypothetical protein
MPELILTLEAMQKIEKRKQRFMAALQGVDLDKDGTEDKGSSGGSAVTAEDVKARAVARLTGNNDLAGAISEGFTPDKGLDYKIMGGTEIG